MAGNGQCSTQCNKLRAKASGWTQKLKNGRLDQVATQIALHTTIYRSLAYCLPATTMTPQQCKKVLQPLLFGTLPRMGVVRTMNRTAVHLPRSLGGLGIPDLYTLQGVEHIKVLLTHGGTQTPTGIILQTLSEFHILEAGSQHSLLELPAEYHALLTPTWMSNTLQFLQEHRIGFDTTLPTLECWTTHDVSIMDTILSHQIISSEECKAINRCRLYLQITMMSDVVNTDGGLLAPCWRCQKYTSLSSQRYVWPHQEKPSASDIKTWQTVLSKSFTNVTPPLATTTAPLRYVTDARVISTWRFDPCNNQLWEEYNRGWRLWKRSSRRHSRRRFFYISTSTCSEPQPSWHLAIVQAYAQRTLLLSHSPADVVIPHPPPATSWLELGKINDGPDLQEFLSSIVEGTAQCVSDGSAKNGRCSMAFQSIGTDIDQPAIEGGQGLPGSYVDNNSFRGEVAGLLGAVVTVNFLCIIYNIHHGSITMGCDNKGALSAGFHSTWVPPCQPSRDILQALHHQLQSSPLTWHTQHVKGHQDDVKQILTQWEQGNVRVDEMATDHRISMDNIPLQSRLPGETWRLILHNTIINSQVEPRLWHHCWKQRAIQYWTRRGRCSFQTHRSIDWRAFGKAMSSLPKNKSQCLTKLFSGFHATGKNMHRRKQWSSPACPFCDHPEDHIHIFQCQSPQASKHFQTAWETLDEWLNKTTSLAIAEAVTDLLLEHRNQTDRTDMSPGWGPSLCDLVNHQRSIGPRSFAEGLLSTKWEEIQNDYYVENQDTRHSAAVWVQHLIQHISTLYHSMWKQRCKVVHSKEGQTSLYQATYALRLRDLLSQPPPTTMPACDRRFFVPLDEALGYSLSRQRRLINMLTSFMEAHELRTNSKSAQIMLSWLAQADAL